MSEPAEPTAANVECVRQFLAAFDRRWPTEDELDTLLSPEIRLVERPNLFNPSGGARDAAGIRAGIEMGPRLLAWQTYEIRDIVAESDTVVARIRWTGELATDAGRWKQGTLLSAWCVGHYRLDRGRIVEIEQHDCYDPPSS